VITCCRCGKRTPQLEPDQFRCPQCEREVAEIIRTDTIRRSRFERSKDLTGARS